MTIEKRFWAKVNKTDTCWLWIGAKSNVGYGSFWVNDRSMSAHRYSMILSGAEVPPDKFACHKCNNRLCVRPDHLYVGTHTDNMRDAARAGNLSHCTDRLKGENHRSAKLNWEKVGEIRQIAATNTMTKRALGAMYGVAETTIGEIVRREIWKEKPAAPWLRKEEK